MGSKLFRPEPFITRVGYCTMSIPSLCEPRSFIWDDIGSIWKLYVWPCLRVITARKRSWGKVMFSRVFVHRVGSASRRGDVHAGWGVGQTSLPSDTMGYGQRAGITHPTGMHSCLIHKNVLVEKTVVFSTELFKH